MSEKLYILSLIIEAVTLLGVIGLIVAYNNLSYINQQSLEQLTKMNSTLNVILKRVAKLSKNNLSYPLLVKVSELTTSPENYENNQIITYGEVHHIVIIPEIRLPYDLILVYENSQVGVSLSSIGIPPGITISRIIPEGSKVIVRGAFVKGTQEHLINASWVKDKETYYIIVLEILKI